MNKRVSGGRGEEDGGKERKADAGDITANKTKTPHRDVGNYKINILKQIYIYSGVFHYIFLY